MSDLNPVGVIALLTGIVLVYAGIKNKYPQDVIREALGKKALRGPIYDGSTVGSDGKTHSLQPIQPSSLGNPLAGVTVTSV